MSGAQWVPPEMMKCLSHTHKYTHPAQRGRNADRFATWPRQPDVHPTPVRVGRCAGDGQECRTRVGRWGGGTQAVARRSQPSQAGDPAQQPHVVFQKPQFQWNGSWFLTIGP